MGPEHQDMEAWLDTIVTTCAMYERDHSKDRDYIPYLPIGETHFVRFGDPQTLMTECAVRDCISAYADANPDTPLGRPRIPRLSFRFQRDSTMYLVVERVPLAEESVPSSDEAGAVLSWLREVPLPHSFPVCRIGGGHMKHRFFPDYEAPLTFSSVDALQRYLSRAFKQLSFAGRRTTKPIDILPERLVLMHPGLNVSLQAGVDTSGAIVLLDLSDFNVLPESFLWLQGNENSNSLARVKPDLCMTADPTLGLDNHGHPKKRKASRGALCHYRDPEHSMLTDPNLMECIGA